MAPSGHQSFPPTPKRNESLSNYHAVLLAQLQLQIYNLHIELYSLLSHETSVNMKLSTKYTWHCCGHKGKEILAVEIMCQNSLRQEII